MEKFASFCVFESASGAPLVIYTSVEAGSVSKAKALAVATAIDQKRGGTPCYVTMSTPSKIDPRIMDTKVIKGSAPHHGKNKRRGKLKPKR